MYYELVYSCISDIGKLRKLNQDNFICNGHYLKPEDLNVSFPISGKVVTKTPNLFGVFDGMGGEECGEIASYIAAEEAFKLEFNNDSVKTLIEYCKQANDKICEYVENTSIYSMGTTAAMLLFSKDNITLCNIGDSKIFRFSNGDIEQISKDHVSISAFGTKPPLSQNLGIPPNQMIIDPYLSQGKYKNGDKYLICSDGLTDMLTLDEIQEVVNKYSVEKAVSNLVCMALENGGKDNVTVVLLEVRKKKIFNIFNR